MHYPFLGDGGAGTANSIGGGVLPSSINPAVLRDVFEILANRWEKQTRNMSSLTAITTHPSYEAVIRLGQDVVPFIIQRIATRPGFWFRALRELTPTIDPVNPKMYGDLRAMTNAWLKWGATRGYVTAGTKV